MISVRTLLAVLAGRKRKSSHTQWEERAGAFGRRAVIHLGHTDDEFEAVTELQRRVILPVFKEALDGTEKTVLDFGCGPGRFTPDLARLVSGHAIGVDVVERFIQMAPVAASVEYRVMHKGRTGLASESIDVVWVCLVLGGLDRDSLTRAVREIERVLRKGGLLFLVENTSDEPSPGHWTFRSVADYRNLFSTVTLKPVGDYFDLGERISMMAGRRHS